MPASWRTAVILVVAFTSLLAWSFASAQSQKPAAVQRWELTKVNRGTEGWEKAQELAGEGWELVAVDVTAFYLKRPK
jgi:hypothetical protein